MFLKGEIMKKPWIYGKNVVISGASGGIGFSVAKTLIEKYDCKVYGIARNEEKIKKAIESLGDKKSNFTYKRSSRRWGAWYIYCNQYNKKQRGA